LKKLGGLPQIRKKDPVKFKKCDPAFDEKGKGLDRQHCKKYFLQ
jgi:hypothetical protein